MLPKLLVDTTPNNSTPLTHQIDHRLRFLFFYFIISILVDFFQIEFLKPAIATHITSDHSIYGLTPANKTITVTMKYATILLALALAFSAEAFSPRT